MGLFTEQANYLIIGKKRSGKSALGWKVAQTIHETQGKKVYVFRYPRPELLERIPFPVENITRFDTVFSLTNAVLYFEEAHKFFSSLNKKIDDKLKNLLGDSGQNNLDVIFVTHNSYFVNRSIFTHIDVRMIKEVTDGHWEIERPHMKKLYENCPIHGVEYYYLDSDYVRGKHKFEKPEWYSEEFSTAFSYNEQPPDVFKEVLVDGKKRVDKDIHDAYGKRGRRRDA
jgi:hypothetical protein